MAYCPLKVNVVAVELAHHERAFQRGNHQRGYFIRLHVRTHDALRNPFCDGALNQAAPRLHRGAGALAKGGIRVVAFDGGIQEHTATLHWRRFEIILEKSDDAYETIERVAPVLEH